MNRIIKMALLGIGSLVALLLAIIFIMKPFLKWYQDSQPSFGSGKDDQYISIKGFKPEDAMVTASAIFYGGGEHCRSRSWSASDGEFKKAGKGIFKINYNFSSQPNQYELRVPYQDYSSSGCNMTLNQITIKAQNDFDTGGFAELRIYPPIVSTDRAISLQSKIEARDCRVRYYDDLKEWSTGLACSFYTNGKIKSRSKDLIGFTAYYVYFDFSQFNPNTTINYDILAGEDYRSKPVDPQ